MSCQILFSGKSKKNISICRLLQILPRVLSRFQFRSKSVRRFVLSFVQLNELRVVKSALRLISRINLSLRMPDSLVRFLLDCTDAQARLNRSCLHMQ